MEKLHSKNLNQGKTRKSMIFLFSATMLISCNVFKASGQKNSHELQTKVACMQNVFETFKGILQKAFDSKKGALPLEELYTLDVSACPGDFTDNFSSVLGILEHTKRSQLASWSLKNEKNLKSPPVLSALNGMMKPDDKPISTLEEAESFLDHALGEDKRKLEELLYKLSQIAADYSVVIE